MRERERERKKHAKSHSVSLTISWYHLFPNKYITKLYVSLVSLISPWTFWMVVLRMVSMAWKAIEDYEGKDSKKSFLGVVHTGMTRWALEGKLHLQSWKTYMHTPLCIYIFLCYSKVFANEIFYILFRRNFKFIETFKE